MFGLGSVAYWMDSTRFSNQREKRFFFGNAIIVPSQVGAIYLQMCSDVLRIQWYLRCLSSSFRSEAMAAFTFNGHCSGRRGR